MPTIDGSRIWKTGAEVRGRREELTVHIDPVTAGIFCGGMMAQVDLLVDEHHPWSEIANESVIELVDSLIPYMHARGVAYMIDNCSTTARLGARKWALRFEAAITQQVFPLLDGRGVRNDLLVKHLEEHRLHEVLKTIGEYRPSVEMLLRSLPEIATVDMVMALDICRLRIFWS
jgi:ketol-acid reductoisomerase